MARRRLPILIALLGLLCSGLPACSDDPQTTTVIIGVTSDYIAGSDLGQLEVVMKVDGNIVRDEALTLGSSAGRTRFPTELAFDEVDDGAELDITLKGIATDGETRVIRTLSTRAKSGPTRLVRVHLEALCRLNPNDGGGPSAPTCDEVAETCISGQCRSTSLDPAQHEMYREDWATGSGDDCKPANAADPIVIVGKGMSDYLPAEDYELANVEAGPQGGHHIWVAARIKNLRQSGSITSVGGEFPSLGIEVPPLKVIFTLDQDEGGFCKLYGLRFQLDIGGQEIEQFLGEDVRVNVEVTDPDGDVGRDELWVTLSDTIQ